jgi:hypothetical protein
MGTRHLITVVKGGEFKLAQYGQWDGYPSGQGATILEFLTTGDVEALRTNVDKLYFPSQEEIDTMYEKAAGIPKGQEWINMEQSDKLKAALPTLHRDTGAKVLEIIASGSSFDDLGRIPTNNMISFAGGWDCEWAYAIDLDNELFEVYQAGFDDEQGANRFSDVITNEFEGSEERPCFVKLVGSYKFDALPTFEEFLAELEPEALERHRARVAALAAEEAEKATEDQADEGAILGDGSEDDEPKPMWSA